jgi:AraC family transcriptional regulator, regulatory protein of adaptative response / methylated-DNA-[protein]-cysteine methyltransferase
MDVVPISAEPIMAAAGAGEGDYDLVRRAIEFISRRFRTQPSLDEIAAHVGVKPLALKRLFARWAGLTPKAFLQAVTLDHARRLLADSASILEASYDLGLSGPGRLHDLFVTHEAVTPGAYKARGAGLTLRYGFHPSPFGTALLMVTDRGLAGLAFADAGGEAVTLRDLQRPWPHATYVEDRAATGPVAQRVFDRQAWRADRPLRVTMIGSDFEVRVWEMLLSVPLGRATTYAAVAARIGRPEAARAVGAAVGRNPISFVVPCHRVLGKGGDLTGYRWGLTRKRAIIGWETGVAGNGEQSA